MQDLVIIGAGASGMIAALKASEQYSNILILESNDKCGKKLLLTGNGRCNYWNEKIMAEHYHTDDVLLLEKLLENSSDTYNFLKTIGLHAYTKEGLYYPYSNSALSVKEILNNAINTKKINVRYNTKVLDITLQDEYFQIICENEKINAKKVIVATGSKSYPKTGSDGIGYQIAQKFGHEIIEVLPALTYLVPNENTHNLEGIRCRVKTTLFIDGSIVSSELGEVQFAKYGLSGICIFNLSSYATRALREEKEVSVELDFAPFTEDLLSFLEKRSNLLVNYNLEAMLESLFNYKLIHYLLKKTNLNCKDKWSELSLNIKKKLVNNIKKMSYLIVDTGNFSNAQVCTGGLSLKDINETCESKNVKNLYFIGEVLNVDGKCGGYNLAFAFTTGYIAGKSI